MDSSVTCDSMDITCDYMKMKTNELLDMNEQPHTKNKDTSVKILCEE